jgi:hypothetical protein
MPAPAGNGNSPPDNINVFIVVPCPPVVVPAPPPPPAPPVICTRPPFRALLIPSVDWSNAHEISLAQSVRGPLHAFCVAIVLAAVMQRLFLQRNVY